MSVYLRKRTRKKGFVYEIIIDRTNAAGKRIRKTRTLSLGTKKTDAEKIAHKIEMEIEFGEYIDRPPTPLSEYFDNVYISNYIDIASLSPTTIKGYKQIFNVKGGIRDILGDEMINNISVDKIQEYVNIQINQYERSVKTVKNHVGLLSGIMERAMIDKYVTKRENPVKYVILPSAVKAETHAYSLQEVKTMFSRASDDNNITMLCIIGLTCLGGGLRRSELAGLKSDRCYVEKNYTNKAIEIVESVVQGTEGLTIRQCKTQNSLRTIPIGQTLTDIIIKQKRRNLEKKLEAGEAFEGNGYLILMDKYPYAPMKPNYIYNTFKKWMKTRCSDLPQYRLHDLRATYASIGADLQFNENNLKSALGHSDIATTQRYYIHNYNESLEKDVNKLEEAFINTEAM